MGLSFLKEHRYTITNNKIEIQIDDDNIPSQITKVEISPQSYKILSAKIGNEVVRVCYINPRKQTVTPSNRIQMNNSIRVHELLNKLRTSNIGSLYANTIKKTICSCHDIFTLETDPLSCTNLTSYTIHPKQDKPINIKSYRPPECHKQEIQTEIR